MGLEKIQKINVNAFEMAPKNAGKAEDMSKSTVPMRSGQTEEVNLDNPLGTMGLEINPNPVIPPTPANAPKVKAVPLPKNIPGRNTLLANGCEKIGNNYYYFNDYGMVEKIYQGDKLKFEISYWPNDIYKVGYYRYYNYDSKGNMIQEIFNDIDENGNVVANVRETIERDDKGRRTRTIHYNINGEPNCWWEHTYDRITNKMTNYECHPNREPKELGEYSNKWFDDSEFYLNGKR